MKETTFNGYQYFADPRYFVLNQKEYEKMFGDGETTPVGKEPSHEDHTEYSDEFWKQNNFTYGNFDGAYFADPRYFVLDQKEYGKLVGGDEPVPPVPPVPPTPSIPHDEIWYTSTDGEIVVPYTPSPGSGSGSGSGNGPGSMHTGGTSESESPLPEILSNTYVDGKGVIKFAEDVETIGLYAFSECETLLSIELPDSVTSIGIYAFDKCSHMASITIPDSVTSIGSGAFQGCSSLQTLVIPDNVKSIGGDSFRGCDNLTSVTLPSGLKSIQGGMFYGCSKLASIDIPESVTLIGDRTFIDCTGMTTITCRPTSVPAMGSNVWTNVPTNIPVYVPAQSIASYQSNSAWYNFTNIQAIQ